MLVCICVQRAGSVLMRVHDDLSWKSQESHQGVLAEQEHTAIDLALIRKVPWSGLAFNFVLIERGVFSFYLPSKAGWNP